MKGMPQKVKILLFVFFLLFTYYCYFHQMKKNTKYYLKLEGKIEKAYHSPNPHHLLVLRYHEHIPYVTAYERILRSRASRFWIVTDEIDPTVNLNYFIYPKELLMSVATQEMLNWKTLGRSKEPVRQFPPKNYEKVVVIDGYSVEVVDQWDGSQ